MDKKKPVDPPCLDRFEKAGDDARNRLLLAWLGDDDHRAALYLLVTKERGGILPFPSRDAAPREPCCPTNENPRPPPEVGHKTVYLVTGRKHITDALEDGGKTYSNRVYGDIGGGKFLLAIDPATQGAAAHAAQMKALCHVFQSTGTMAGKVSHHACQSAAILSLRAQNFDLAAFAEQAALRFCKNLFGYATGDHRLLESAHRAGYRALVHQVLGRHFVTDPLAIPEAEAAMGRLLVRTGALIDGYAAGDEDVLEGCAVSPALAGLVPGMKLLGEYTGALNGEQRATIIVGAVVGTVGNVQAAACIAVKAFFGKDALWDQARALAWSEPAGDPTNKFKQWQALIGETLRLNPPIAFVPRVVIPAQGEREAFSEFILALGGGTGDPSDPRSGDDPLIWGLPDSGRHWCLGRDLAWSLIVEIVRHVMRLPGLAQRLDPLDASVIGLTKRWGFACDSYPLSHRRERRVAQSALNVAMRIKSPVKDNAARLREVIRAGAPRIDEALREARHVHFAWFEFIEHDTVLVLHTVYDGDFAAYVQHFALRVGDLFDTLFECMEEAPPKPVAKFPNDFVAHIQRYNRAPAMGYFFSAYPRSEAARIMRDERARP